jgi:phosphotransferase system HPr-like phosphotransfer protein
MIEKKIRELKTEVYFIKNNMRKKIKEVKDILSLQVAQGETIGIQVFPSSKKDIQELQKTIIEINSITFS